MREIQKDIIPSQVPIVRAREVGKDTQAVHLGNTEMHVPYKPCDSHRDQLIEKAWKLKSSSVGRASSKPNKVCVDGFNIGELIDGKYRVNEFIGSGGLGVIYSATDSNGNRVAIKALKGGEIPEMHMQRFLREASVMAFLDHQNIVSLIDVGVDKDRPYIAMEYVGNGTFMDVVRLYHNGYIDLSTAVHYTADLCLALDKVHEDGRFVHRDLSPANILLSDQTTNLMDRKVDRNVIKLADFGLTHVSDASKMLTDFGEIMGTVRFSPVIDMVGGKVDARSDLYSVGILLYYLVMKKLPFDDPEGGDSKKGIIAICDQHLYKNPSFDSIDTKVPSTLIWLIKQLLEKDPDNRPQKASEVESILREIAIGTAASTSLIVAPMFNPALEIFTNSVDHKKEDEPLMQSTIIDSMYYGITPDLLEKVAIGEDLEFDVSFDPPVPPTSLKKVLIVDNDITRQTLVDAYVTLWSNETSSCNIEALKCKTVKEAFDFIIEGIMDGNSFDMVISNNRTPLSFYNPDGNQQYKLQGGEVLHKILSKVAPQIAVLLYDQTEGLNSGITNSGRQVLDINSLDGLVKQLGLYDTYFRVGDTTQIKASV